jgi:hypothetical protein
MGRWDEKMKLFKRSPFRSLRGAIRSDQAPVDEDKSIGSDLSEADQFDILIPLRTGRVLPLFGRDEGSEISSITSDDRHYRNSSRRTTKKSPRGTILTTCCYGSATNKTNGSVAAHGGGASQATGSTPLVPLSSSSLFDFACCGPAPIDEKVKRVKRTRGKGSVASLVPTNSLFDSVMSDDEQNPVEEITLSSRKRRKSWKLPGKLRGLPWRRSRYDM